MTDKELQRKLEVAGKLIIETMRNTLLTYKTYSSFTGKTYTLKDSRFIQNMEEVVTNDRTDEYTLAIYLPKYHNFIETGRAPGKMPPSKPILEWMIRHHIPKSALFPIRKKIAQEGIKKRPFSIIYTKRIAAIENILLNTAKENIEEELDKMIERFEKAKG